MWEKFSQTQAYKIWTGYAFENLGLKHIPQIKKALGISGIYSESSTYRSPANDEVAGVQIDLLIDRNDHVINLFELKFHHTEFIITKEYAGKLRSKMAIFKTNTKTKKQLFISLLTVFGIHKNKHSLNLIDKSLTVDELFVPL